MKYIRFCMVTMLCFLMVNVIAMPKVAADMSKPIVIAHRGASGYRPEHTLEAYKLAIEQGADFIEPDLVMTKDGYFVARHDIYLSDSTDIEQHPEFASRKRSIEGKNDWFVFDFTLAELRTLRAIQPRKNRGTMYDGQYLIPTYDEIRDLVESARRTGSNVGLYIEMKRPDLMPIKGVDLAEKLAVFFTGLHDQSIPAYFQCFDGDFLLQVGAKSAVPLVYLYGGTQDPISGKYRADKADLDPYWGKVAGIGPYKMVLLDDNNADNGLLTYIHSKGAVVHIWTIRDDTVPTGFPSVKEELAHFYTMGVDGVFTDFPDTALNVIKEREER